MKNAEICLGCRFYDGGEAASGECRRYPPVIVRKLGIENTDASLFPVVDETGWCGEYKSATPTEDELVQYIFGKK